MNLVWFSVNWLHFIFSITALNSKIEVIPFAITQESTTYPIAYSCFRKIGRLVVFTMQIKTVANTLHKETKLGSVPAEYSPINPFFFAIGITGNYSTDSSGQYLKIDENGLITINCKHTGGYVIVSGCYIIAYR